MVVMRKGRIVIHDPALMKQSYADPLLITYIVTRWLYRFIYIIFGQIPSVDKATHQRV